MCCSIVQIIVVLHRYIKVFTVSVSCVFLKKYITAFKCTDLFVFRISPPDMFPYHVLHVIRQAVLYATLQAVLYSFVDDCHRRSGFTWMYMIGGSFHLWA